MGYCKLFNPNTGEILFEIGEDPLHPKQKLGDKSDKFDTASIEQQHADDAAYERED